MKPTTPPTQAAETPSKSQVAIERIRPELNLEKWSIWQPAKSKNPLRPRLLQREITTAEGNKITAKVEIAPTTRGVLTTEDQKTLYALIKHWEEKGKSKNPTFFSLKGLAKLLKKRWGTNVIDSLTESLLRLRITAFIWENSYYDKAAGETVEVLDTFNILSDLKIVKRRQDGHVTKEGGYFRFNDFVLNNLLVNHTKPLLFDVVVGFKSEVAQLLYVYIDLIMSDKTLYERRTKELFDDLGLEGKAYKNPSNRKQVLDRALKEMQGVRLTTGVLTTAKLQETNDGKDWKIVFRKGARATLPVAADEEKIQETPAATLSLSKTEQESRQQATELVKYFYQLFHGTEKNHISSKATDQAVSLIAQYGIEQARYVVDYAKRQAPETNYQPQTFGGILQYTNRAIDEYQEFQHRQQQRIARDAEYEETRRLEEEHAEYCRQAIDAYIAEHSEELPGWIEEAKKALLQERPSLYSLWPEQTFTDFAERAVRSDIFAELDLPTFGDYYNEHRSREATAPSPDQVDE